VGRLPRRVLPRRGGGDPPTEENEEGEEEPLEFTHDDKVEALGFDPDRTEELLGAGGAPRPTSRNWSTSARST